MNLTLVNKEHLVGNIWAFRFEPDEPLEWIPGQYMQVKVPHDASDSEGIQRWFTVSSAPYEKILQITTRVTSSTFKQALSQLAIGSQIALLEEPHGDFVWQDSELPIVFIAAGIGVTPFHSILKQRAHDGKKSNVTLIYGGRDENLPFKDELAAWSQADNSLKIHYVIGGLLTAQKIAEIVPDINSSLVYVSGPEPMVEALSRELKAAGLPDPQLKRDDFPNYNERNY